MNKPQKLKNPIPLTKRNLPKGKITELGKKILKKLIEQRDRLNELKESENTENNKNN